MSMTIDCTNCGTKLSVKDDMLGKKVKCPKCSSVVVVEQPEEELEAAPVAVAKRTDQKYRAECGALISARAVVCPKCGVEQADDGRSGGRRSRTDDSKRIPAGIFALLLGGFGIHKFVLGYTTAGIIQILITLFTCGAGHIIPLIEGIIYLTKSDEEFIRTYQIGQRAWF